MGVLVLRDQLEHLPESRRGLGELPVVEQRGGVVVRVPGFRLDAASADRRRAKSSVSLLRPLTLTLSSRRLGKMGIPVSRSRRRLWTDCDTTRGSWYCLVRLSTREAMFTGSPMTV